jgi:hypothetical protein
VRTTEEAYDESHHLVGAAHECCELGKDCLDSGDREKEVEGVERDGDVANDDVDLVGDGLLDVGDCGSDVAVDGDANGESLSSTRVSAATRGRQRGRGTHDIESLRSTRQQRERATDSLGQADRDLLRQSARVLTCVGPEQLLQLVVERGVGGAALRRSTRQREERDGRPEVVVDLGSRMR